MLGSRSAPDHDHIHGLPRGIYIRAHAVAFFISLLNTVDGSAERTLTEIEGWEDLSPDGKNDRGLQIIARLPAPTPGEHTDRTGAASNPAATAILWAKKH